MHHPLRHFVDGAIAARRQDQVRAVLDVRARNRARRGGAGRRGHRDVVPLPGEDFHDALNARAAAPSEFSRAGIVDQDGLPVACNGAISASSLNYR